MTPRDAALLPRLLLALDTLENEGEIVQAVLQVRRILKAEKSGLAKLPELAANLAAEYATNIPTDKITMADDRRDVAMRLRNLGLLLRLARHPDRATEEALDRARMAMVGGTLVAGEDLRSLLACLHDLIKAKATPTREYAYPMHEPPRPMHEQTTYRAEPLTPEKIQEMMDRLRDALPPREPGSGIFNDYLRRGGT